MNYFTDTAVNILGNSKLRTPQIEAYIKAQGKRPPKSPCMTQADTH